MSSADLCKWCGNALTDSEVQDDGTVCNACSEQIAGTNNLPFDELYSLPYGVITLNQEGVVTSYNQWEQNLSGKSAAEVIGKNFFTEIAPCTQVKKFSGRFTAFLTSQRLIEAFDFTFAFPKLAVDVSIAFVKPPDEPAPQRITVLVRRN